MFAKSTYGIPILLAALALPLNLHAASLDIVSGYSPVTGAVHIEPGYEFSGDQGKYAAYTNPGNLALGAAVTSDGDLGGYSIHQVSHLTDGYYGNGRSWVDDGIPSANLVIDLGLKKDFDTLAFGRDRLTSYTDRPPGQFIIYAMLGGSMSWTEIFDSSDFVFNGSTQGFKQTNVANFDNVTARMVRLQLVSAAGSAIDEIEIMNLSPVPVPAAAWLFGSALIALVGFGNRRKTGL